MVKEPLVVPDHTFAEAILAKLDKQKKTFPITVALWLKQNDEWMLVIATPEYERLGAQHAYMRFIGILSEDGPMALSTLPIRLEGHKNPLIRDLRRLFGKTASVGGMRLGGHMIGGQWIEDAYVYRVK